MKLRLNVPKFCGGGGSGGGGKLSLYNSIMAFWNAMSCSLVDRYQCFKEVCCLLHYIGVRNAEKRRHRTGKGQEPQLLLQKPGTHYPTTLSYTANHNLQQDCE
jgi:hypothetical protein